MTVVVCPLEDVTVYPVMGDPPVLAGAVQLTVADASPPVAVPIAGALGRTAGAAGVTGLDAVDARLVPTALMARTVKV
jgi:hypothetical protein